MKLNQLSTLEKIIVCILVILQIAIPFLSEKLLGRFVISDRFKGLALYYKTIGNQKLVEESERLYAYFHMIEVFIFFTMLGMVISFINHFHAKNKRLEFNEHEMISNDLRKSSKISQIQILIYFCLIFGFLIIDQLSFIWRIIYFLGCFAIIMTILDIIRSKKTHKVDKRIANYYKTGELEFMERDPDLENLNNRQFQDGYRLTWVTLFVIMIVLGYFGIDQCRKNLTFIELPDTIYLNRESRFNKSSLEVCNDRYGFVSCSTNFMDQNFKQKYLIHYRVESIELSFTDENYERVLKDVNYGIKVIHHVYHYEIAAEDITIDQRDGKWYFSFKVRGVIPDEPFESIGVYFYDQETEERLDTERYYIPDFKITLIKAEKGN
jgi:hypothetical protein